jgi:hypothetical protein
MAGATSDMPPEQFVLRTLVCAAGIWLILAGFDRWSERQAESVVIGALGVVILIGAWIP